MKQKFLMKFYGKNAMLKVQIKEWDDELIVEALQNL